jgi:probable F420-dependent oxidoreductase
MKPAASCQAERSVDSLAVWSPLWEVAVLIDVTYGRPGLAIGADARKAEAIGFDGCWVGETNSDPFLKALEAAQTTSAVAIGTAVAIAFARTPMTLAYSGHDLARAAQGRFILGLGSQVKSHIERRFSMPWSRPAERMRELILATRAIWDAWETGTDLAFQGEFYDHTLMTPFFSPDVHEFGPPPIYLAAVGQRMTTVAGEVADGLIFHPFTTARYLSEVTLPALHKGATNRPHSSQDHTVAVCGPVFACIGRDQDELDGAIAASRKQLAFYASTPSYRAVLDLHGWGDLQPELTRLSKLGDWEAMGSLIDDDVLAGFAVIGGPEDVAVQLKERWGLLADRISLYTPYEVESQSLERLIAAFPR